MMTPALAEHSAPHKQQGQPAGRHTGQTDEANLTIAHRQHAGKDLTPGRRAEQGQQALKHQHQGQGRPQGFGQKADPDVYLRAGAGAAPPLAPDPRMALKNSLLGSSTITSVLLRKLAR
jgi:hypothetical protein